MERKTWLLGSLFLLLTLSLVLLFTFLQSSSQPPTSCMNISQDVSRGEKALLVWMTENDLSQPLLAEPLNPCTSLNTTCDVIYGYAVEQDAKRLGFLILNESAPSLVQRLTQKAEERGLRVYPASFFSNAAPGGETGVSIVSRLEEGRLGVLILIPLNTILLLAGEAVLENWTQPFPAFRVQEPIAYDPYLAYMNATWPEALAVPETCINP